MNRPRHSPFPISLIAFMGIGLLGLGLIFSGSILALAYNGVNLLPRVATPANVVIATPPATSLPTALSPITAAPSAVAFSATSHSPQTTAPSIPFPGYSLYRQSQPPYDDNVRLIQKRLIQLGYVEVGEVDGYFGQKTESAIKHFQTVNGLAVDGVVGPETWGQLFGDAAIIAPPAIVPPTAAALTGHIVFVSYRDGDEEIYIMNADGSNQTRLTYSQYGDIEPVLSPDGQHIAFVSQRRNTHQLFIMNADGSDQRALTGDVGIREYDPYFSPDGEWIVFSSERGGQFDLWLIHPDGSGLQQLTSGSNGKNFPAWSPDGQWIAYNSIENGEDIVKTIRPDGTGDGVVLELDEAYISGWAGDRILFVAKDGDTTDVYSVNLDGSDVRQLTSDPANDKGAFGAPDGQFVVFNSARNGDDEIYVMRADGSAQTRLTFSSRNDYMPAWGP